MSNLWQEQVRRDRDPELEEINRLALARIREMEKEIRERTGLYLHSGIELEFYTEDENGQKSALINADVYADKVAAQRRSSYIERFYPETEKGAFEIAQGFSQYQEEDIRTVHAHRSPARQAEHMDRVRQRIVQPDYWKQPQIKNISLSIKPGDERKKTSALQVSISAYTKDGKNVFAEVRPDKSYPEPSQIMHLCANALVLVQQHTLLLATPYPDSYEQLRSIFPGGQQKHFGTGRKTIRQSGEVSVRLRDYYDKQDEYKARYPNISPEHFYYLENCLPRANGNVYLATLQTVAGMHLALTEHVRFAASDKDVLPGYSTMQRPDGGYVMYNYVPNHLGPLNFSGFQHNIQIFENSGFVQDLLGEELHARIAAYFSPAAIRARESRLDKPERI